MNNDIWIVCALWDDGKVFFSYIFFTIPNSQNRENVSSSQRRATNWDASESNKKVVNEIKKIRESCKFSNFYFTSIKIAESSKKTWKGWKQRNKIDDEWINKNIECLSCMMRWPRESSSPRSGSLNRWRDLIRRGGGKSEEIFKSYNDFNIWASLSPKESVNINDDWWSLILWRADRQHHQKSRFLFKSIRPRKREKIASSKKKNVWVWIVIVIAYFI